MHLGPITTYVHVVKAFARWAAGERLTNRLPKLSLITLSPPLNSGIIGLRMGPYVPTPKFFTISGDPGTTAAVINTLTNGVVDRTMGRWS